jgi:ABC-2 type transport system ATP-binding protein
MIELSQISKQYKNKQVLNNISLSLSAGKILGIIGPNGAGKSTLMEITCSILKPSSGDILFNNQSIHKDINTYRQSIGYVPQELALYQTLTVLDNINFWASLSPLDINQARKNRILSVVGLKGKEKEKVNNLSGGMKRKLNIAVALLHDPDILIMDEPTVGIDIQSKMEIMQFIQSLKDTGKTVFYSSHDPYEIENLCDEILILNEGSLRYKGPVTEIVNEAKRRKILSDDESFTSLLAKLGQW